MLGKNSPSFDSRSYGFQKLGELVRTGVPGGQGDPGGRRVDERPYSHSSQGPDPSIEGVPFGLIASERLRLHPPALHSRRSHARLGKDALAGHASYYSNAPAYSDKRLGSFERNE